MAGADRIEPEHLGLPTVAAQPKQVLNLKEAERQHVLQVLNQCGGNRSRAAEALGISERHLYRMLQGKQPDLNSQEGDKDVSPA
jgi:DNA-binding NtrC family response regulator